MKALYFTHDSFVKPGSLDLTFRDLKWDTETVYFFEKYPKKINWNEYQVLIILGGTMGVYEEAIHPFLIDEFRLVEDAMKNDIPIMGICFGAQVLARVLGATVRKHHIPEIGWHEVFINEAGQRDPLFKPYGIKLDVIEWHSDVFELPANTIHLAYSRIAPNQAFRYGNRVYGVQFHYEMDQEIIDESFKFNKDEMKKLSYLVDFEAFYQTTVQKMNQYQQDAKAFFKRFIELMYPQ
jgi:GMP synthase (glutamine-hydrolysing)